MSNYVSKQIEQDVLASLKRVANIILNRLKQQAPVDTGKLRRSITYSITKDIGGYRLYFGYIYYGMFVDLGVNGTKKGYGSPFSFKKRKYGIPPQRWTSLDNVDEEIEQIIEEAFGKSMFSVLSEILTRSEKLS